MDRKNNQTDLYYYRARYYSPALQRFISEDPIEFRGGDVNLHSYVFNSPTNFNDPSGKVAPIVLMGGGFLIGGLLGAGASILIDTMAGRKINWHKAGNAFVAAGIAGGLTALGGAGLGALIVPGLDGVGTAIAANAVVGLHSGMLGQMAADTIAPPGRFITDGGERRARLAAAGCWGMLGGTVGGAIGRPTSSIIGANAIAAGSQTEYPSELPPFPWY